MNQPTDVRYAQLFLDDEIVEQTVRLQRVVHQPHKHYANPIYTVGAPWEGNGVVYLAGVYIVRRTTFGRHGMPPYTHQHTLRLFTQSV